MAVTLRGHFAGRDCPQFGINLLIKLVQGIGVPRCSVAEESGDVVHETSWLHNCSRKALNKLFYSERRAHLSFRIGTLGHLPISPSLLPLLLLSKPIYPSSVHPCYQCRPWFFFASPRSLRLCVRVVAR